MKVPQLMDAQAGRAPPLQSAHSLLSGLARIDFRACSRCAFLEKKPTRKHSSRITWGGRPVSLARHLSNSARIVMGVLMGKGGEVAEAADFR